MEATLNKKMMHTWRKVCQSNKNIYITIETNNTLFLCTCWVSHMHHGVCVIWTDSDGNIGLRWNMLKQLFGACLHAIHVRDDMFAVHVVHYIEVAHFIFRGTTVYIGEKMNELLNVTITKIIWSHTCTPTSTHALACTHAHTHTQNQPISYVFCTSLCIMFLLYFA